MLYLLWWSNNSTIFGLSVCRYVSIFLSTFVYLSHWISAIKGIFLSLSLSLLRKLSAIFWSLSQSLSFENSSVDMLTVNQMFINSFSVIQLSLVLSFSFWRSYVTLNLTAQLWLNYVRVSKYSLSITASNSKIENRTENYVNMLSY